MTTDLDLIHAIQAVVGRWQQATPAWDPSWASMAEIRDLLADWAQEAEPPLHRQHVVDDGFVTVVCVHCGQPWPCDTARRAAEGRPIAEPVVLEPRPLARTRLPEARVDPGYAVRRFGPQP